MKVEKKTETRMLIRYHRKKIESERQIGTKNPKENKIKDNRKFV